MSLNVNSNYAIGMARKGSLADEFVGTIKDGINAKI